MTAPTIDIIVEDLKFAAEAGAEFDYELDETDPIHRTIVITTYDDDGEAVGHYRMWVEFEELDAWETDPERESRGTE